CESGDQLSDQGCTACVSIWDDPSDCCDYPSHTWAELDYLHWWVQGYAIPPLVTAAPLGSSGALNDPNAVILLGSDRLDSGDRSGARARVGWWFDCCETHGIQVEFFGLEREGTRLDLVSSLPNAILYRPFFNTDPSNFGPDAQQADRISVASSSQLYSGNALYRHNWKCDFEPCGCRSYRIDFLAGYRYLRLDEDLTIRETASFGPNTFDITDRFTADNQFHGGELGVVGNFHRGDWSLELLAKVALGNNHQTVTVWGEEVTTINGLSPSIRSGGLLAQPTNIRSETRNAFAVLPEAGAELGYLLTDNLRLTVGYTILWLSHAVRPGDQIDPLVDGRFLNPNLVPPYTPPATRPAPRFTESSLWAQGIHLGLEWHY
ncbi:MAG: BBP7 family outer membrane beta-barrel protein, partial [Planctomycetales bacterium]|nr:BBP7 family outer membrane beta-barrel protein [Planctomycetales bacterium]NIM07720.1 BBP7 family outer membrane beta-barrel protein [Planctomycetales bacterium]NIN07223.1 BBP7 family outer membrane beta-barrel protein [Planctomycetales bacterium]NIN76316.1 BBP7 family outer membrane beta-barrel protein [Planctomycetales bacterium]NIO33521.1 BBP7 family outer membrane beta-barrel protein [Planctomycetales bacterium]